MDVPIESVTAGHRGRRHPHCCVRRHRSCLRCCDRRHLSRHRCSCRCQQSRRLRQIPQNCAGSQTVHSTRRHSSGSPCSASTGPTLARSSRRHSSDSPCSVSTASTSARFAPPICRWRRHSSGYPHQSTTPRGFPTTSEKPRPLTRSCGCPTLSRFRRQSTSALRRPTRSLCLWKQARLCARLPCRHCCRVRWSAATRSWLERPPAAKVRTSGCSQPSAIRCAETRSWATPFSAIRCAETHSSATPFSAIRSSPAHPKSFPIHHEWTRSRVRCRRLRRFSATRRLST